MNKPYDGTKNRKGILNAPPPESPSSLGDWTLLLVQASSAIALVASAEIFILSKYLSFMQYTTSYVSLVESVVPVPVLIHAVLSTLAITVKGIVPIHQAWCEIQSNRDMNNSGNVGDIVLPETVEVIRPIPVNTRDPQVLSSVRLVNVNGVKVVEEELLEFMSKVNTKGHARGRWIDPPYKFTTGTLCDRGMYDAFMSYLEMTKAVTGRTERYAGKLVKSARQMLSEYEARGRTPLSAGGDI